jgi:hypothetical protein
MRFLGRPDHIAQANRFRKQLCRPELVRRLVTVIAARHLRFTRLDPHCVHVDSVFTK